MLKVGVVGVGHIGSVIAAELALRGSNVIAIDLDSRKVNSINNKKAPISEPGLDELINVLSSIDPVRSCWTWAGIQDVAWVIRRMAHETAVHAWDAHVSAGNNAEIEAALASDGIDEYVHVMLVSNMRDGEALLSGSVHIHCTDVDGEWLIVPTDTSDVVVTREHAKGDCAIRGSASQLLLGLWRRTPMSSLEVIGSSDVAAQFLNRTANN